MCTKEGTSKFYRASPPPHFADDLASHHFACSHLAHRHFEANLKPILPSIVIYRGVEVYIDSMSSRKRKSTPKAAILNAKRGKTSTPAPPDIDPIPDPTPDPAPDLTPDLTPDLDPIPTVARATPTPIRKQVDLTITSICCLDDAKVWKTAETRQNASEFDIRAFFETCITKSGNISIRDGVECQQIGFQADIQADRTKTVEIDLPEPAEWSRVVDIVQNLRTDGRKGITVAITGKFKRLLPKKATPPAESAASEVKKQVSYPAATSLVRYRSNSIYILPESIHTEPAATSLARYRS